MNTDAGSASLVSMMTFLVAKAFVFDYIDEVEHEDIINSREAIAEAIIGLVLVFFISSSTFFYDHMTSQPLQICFLFIRSCNFN